MIPARGGSKGIPRKNLQRVGGVPLLGRAIASARAAQQIDRVVVSTDDSEIAAVAREWGAEVIDRPAELSTDVAGSEAALLHALAAFDSDAASSATVQVLVFIQATSPFIDPNDLDAAIERVVAGEADVAFSAVQSWGFLWRNATESGGGAGAVGINHDAAVRPRRQDREPEFLETGAFYVMRAEGFRAARHRFFGRTAPAFVPELHALEIDTREQLTMANTLAPLVTTALSIDVDAVVTDFDGVHTDDSAFVGHDGSEVVRVSRSDGMGVRLLREAGIPVLILSTETNPVVTARAKKLRVDVIQGSEDKVTALTDWARTRGIALDRIAYLGNDVNDLGCFARVGWPVAVPDAHPRVLTAARLILGRSGGDGAVRELAESVLQARDVIRTTGTTRTSHTTHSTRQQD